jgi:DNA-binding NtrC family response regulator
MSKAGTVRHGARSMPVVTLRVEVVDGPDVGRAVTAPGDVLRVGTADGNDLILRDPTVSRFHLEMTFGTEGVRLHDPGSTNGTFVGPARIERAVVGPGTTVRVGKTSLRVAEGGEVTVDLAPGDTLAGLRGRSPGMRRLMEQIQRAAPSDASVLVYGESGTGKELIARALHELGPRSKAPFVTVDCGALAPTLVASELFGHERGAFTGADRQHVGAFEQAGGGTIFLDEIGELPASLQSSLLGVLERRRFRRLGGRADIAIDVRVVSATHRDLRGDVNAGSFRLDLYYRLAVVTLQVPPLRERAEDIPLLVRHFLAECGHDGPVEDLFPAPMMLELSANRWPGNVRELRNVVEATITMGQLPPMSVREPAAGPPAGQGADRSLDALMPLAYKEARASLLHSFEARYLSELLRRTEGNVSRAAREASLDRSHLTQLLRKHNLK